MDDNVGTNDIPAADGSDIPQGASGTDDATGTSIANQNGSQPSGQPDADENRRLKGQISALQRQVIQARRSQGGQPQGQPQGQGQDQPAGGDVASQIAVAYEIADGQLRRQMEGVYDLYPELSKEELSMLRRNPWTFASRETFMSGDVETAKLEIEQWIADTVEARAKGQPAPTPPSGKVVNPAPAPTSAPEPAVPGSDEDQNPWSMPMASLEKKVVKEKARLTSR